jgi:hypothetical protein
MCGIMAKIVRGTKTNEWLPWYWRKSTFPILSQPAKTLNDIAGTAFLLHYKKIPYIVTASHVIEMENPVIAFSRKDRQLVCVSSAYLQQTGLKWIKHPVGFDLAAIPFHLPLSLVKELDVLSITEDKWTPQSKIKVGDEVAHLGYPQKGTSIYRDGSPCIYPQAMPGKIIRLNQSDIIMKTASAHGASGGPVFLRRENDSPCLVSIVTEARMFGKHTRPAEAAYCNETRALIVSLVKDILETVEMKKQYNNRWIGENWLLRRYAFKSIPDKTLSKKCPTA